MTDQERRWFGQWTVIYFGMESESGVVQTFDDELYFGMEVQDA